jgi:molybdopterin biosynthesis enzyme
MGTLPRETAAGSPADTVPIVLLPGQPFACLVAYDLLASRLVRRLTGADGALPYPVADFPLARKIASGIGSAEVVPMRLTGGLARPIGADGGLIGAMQADGFVLVGETSEGYPAGAMSLSIYTRGFRQEWQRTEHHEQPRDHHGAAPGSTTGSIPRRRHP